MISTRRWLHTWHASEKTGCRRYSEMRSRRTLMPKADNHKRQKAAERAQLVKPICRSSFGCLRHTLSHAPPGWASSDRGVDASLCPSKPSFLPSLCPSKIWLEQVKRSLTGNACCMHVLQKVTCIGLSRLRRPAICLWYSCEDSLPAWAPSNSCCFQGGSCNWRILATDQGVSA